MRHVRSEQSDPCRIAQLFCMICNGRTNDIAFYESSFFIPYISKTLFFPTLQHSLQRFAFASGWIHRGQKRFLQATPVGPIRFQAEPISCIFQHIGRVIGNNALLHLVKLGIGPEGRKLFQHLCRIGHHPLFRARCV